MQDNDGIKLAEKPILFVAMSLDSTGLASLAVSSLGIYVLNLYKKKDMMLVNIENFLYFKRKICFKCKN